MTAKQVCNIVPARMRQYCDAKDELALNLLDDLLSSELQPLAWRQGYIAARRNGQDHKAAVKRANRTLTGVRKLIGLSYPDSAEIHV